VYAIGQPEYQKGIQAAKSSEPAVNFMAVYRSSSRWPVGWPSNIGPLSCCTLVCCLLLAPFLRGSSLQNGACGELFNPQALRHLKTLCVDTSYLEAGVALDVKTFVAKENQPGQLLTRLSWKITEDCAGADALIRVYFAPSERHVALANDALPGQRAPSGQMAPLEENEQVTQVVLLIYDRASVRVLYRTEGHGAGKNRGALLKGPFSRLVKDMKALDH